MAANFTLSHPALPRKSAINKTGVLTLSGFGIRVRQHNNHLEIEDGVGLERRRFRLPRVGHGLKRLVIIGNDGFVSLAALRWLADQDVAFVMLNRDGSVLATTGPVRPSDARLRRAQAVADRTGAALQIGRELISKKLAGQEQVARDELLDETTAGVIADFRRLAECAETIHAIRHFESQGAAAYWAAWRNLPIAFPKNELARVPHHWRRFTARQSPLTGSPRLATDPVNAILNYLFAILESEASLAAAALGLDAGLGFIHLDAPARDSLACDLMEPVRPQVEGWLLDWVTREPLSRRWFFEQRDGSCRLMAEFAARLSQTAPTWARAVAPYAEWVARTLWRRRRAVDEPATRLTQDRKREARTGVPAMPIVTAPKSESVCRVCGKSLPTGRFYCGSCAVGPATERILEAGPTARVLGRGLAYSEEAQVKRKATRQRHAIEEGSWAPSSLPDWLNEHYYAQKIQPRLRDFTNSKIATLLGVSKPYASAIRAGRVPHPRHWKPLAELLNQQT